ncbi:hypothetical protein [Xanthomarina spongicola]|jgi:hypothetical protein|uniref:Uncharacterized protein n=1 Tax=Xanthomarina spongicola TaxID=570520 RepID=A0A316DR27_9FLAO|nr:hypothetical protein [Xanthomarina spongicola]PWK19153.1 hypothetical protein LX78_01633 [Xanthomarina spongicola]
MGGEGSMMHMIHTLRNNKSMLNKRKDRRVINGSFSGEKLEFQNTATHEDLIKIRLKLQKERKQKLLKTIVIFSIFMITFLSVIIYFF